MTATILKAGESAYMRAAEILSAGGLVALPTETVYGLAADAANDDAIKAVYAAKGRPSSNPLICHIMAPDHAGEVAQISPLAARMIENFFPGPLTLVLPQANNFSEYASAGHATIAVRCPDTEWRQAFYEIGFRGPLVMPSANISGHVSPTCAEHVFADLGDKIDLIIDAGECMGGIESTILKIDGDRATLLRPGSITAADLAPYVGQIDLPRKGAKTVAPGMLKSHYAPKAKVRLNALEKRRGENYLAFGKTDILADLNLSASGDLKEAASNLYAALRELDTGSDIAVAPIPDTGVGIAINDRLRRAAAERPNEP